MNGVLLNGNVAPRYPSTALAWGQVLERAAGRRSVVIINPTANVAYLSWDPGASGVLGYPLPANGGSLILTAVLNGSLCTNEMYAAATVAPGSLVIFEEHA